MKDRESAESFADAPSRPNIVSINEADPHVRYDDVFEEMSPDEVVAVRWREGAYEFACRNGFCLRVQVWSPRVLRLRYSPDGVFQPGPFYALCSEEPSQRATATLSETANEFVLATSALQLTLTKTSVLARFYDANDHLLNEDAAAFLARRSVLRGWHMLKISKRRQRKEAFYGLGDKACEPNLCGKVFENWCTDAEALERGTGPLYRAIPVYYGIHQGLSYGIFLNNTFKTHFDFDSQGDGIVSFWAEGGELDYFFLYGSTPTEVVQAYVHLTGKPSLPPLWTLGFHQGCIGHLSQGRVLETANTFRQLRIPCDAFCLDVDYTEGFRCFTWNRARFPDLKGLMKALRERNFHATVVILPGVREDSSFAVYREGVNKRFFLRASDGTLAKGPVWRGFCAFPDFSNPEAREWWGDLHRELYTDIGISGFWNDMNEPTVSHVRSRTLPDDVLHSFERRWATHRQLHNVYGLLMTRACWEGLRRLRPEKRPFVLTRSTFSGGQRYAAVWAGEHCSSWEHLALANVQCQRLSISGFSFCGSDIGGSYGMPDGELFVRWLQLAVFHPLMRLHGSEQRQHTTHEAQQADVASPAAQREPWSFGDRWTMLAQKAIELRYALLPYLYTAMWKNSRDGTPVLQHAAFVDPTDPKLRDVERDFLCGDHLWVSPVVQPKVQRQLVYLPKGQWFYFWNGHLASGELFVNVLPEQIPFFVRAGAVLPTYPVLQYTGGVADIKELTLYVYYHNTPEAVVSHLYEDAGEGYDYQQGEFCLRTWTTISHKQSFYLRQQIEGSKPVYYKKIKIFLVGFPSFLRKCLVDDAEAPIKEIRLHNRTLYQFILSPDFQRIEWHA
ncbi:MAG: glycoside hydrolase family 31 protein [Saprospiraceae bacterium]|nr:glycoside hydrolase family 31 protein [Saprospiraceae bacterium]MDW8483472.1 glycoside hydrolase family 31 protein [Saprospiraceae bacterium]